MRRLIWLPVAGFLLIAGAAVATAAPEVPTQWELAREIGRAMRRPAIFPVPAFLLRLVLWGQADIVLHGRVAIPEKALAAGYRFQYPTVESAMRNVIETR